MVKNDLGTVVVNVIATCSAGLSGRRERFMVLRRHRGGSSAARSSASGSKGLATLSPRESGSMAATWARPQASQAVNSGDCTDCTATGTAVDEWLLRRRTACRLRPDERRTPRRSATIRTSRGGPCRAYGKSWPSLDFNLTR
jgi:hypothetical protein